MKMYGQNIVKLRRKGNSKWLSALGVHYNVHFTCNDLCMLCNVIHAFTVRLSTTI